jgi:hypothetical protein
MDAIKPPADQKIVAGTIDGTPPSAFAPGHAGRSSPFFRDSDLEEIGRESCDDACPPASGIEASSSMATTNVGGGK